MHHERGLFILFNTVSFLQRPTNLLDGVCSSTQTRIAIDGALELGLQY